MFQFVTMDFAGRTPESLERHEVPAGIDARDRAARGVQPPGFVDRENHGPPGVAEVEPLIRVRRNDAGAREHGEQCMPG